MIDFKDNFYYDLLQSCLLFVDEKSDSEEAIANYFENDKSYLIMEYCWRRNFHFCFCFIIIEFIFLLW